MFKEIFRFELRYRSKRTATFIYFAIIFLLCFLTVATDGVDTGGAMGQIKQNAPYVLSRLSVVFSVFLCLISSAIMGVGVLRDFEQNTESIFFSTPIRKYPYLAGRFWGSFVVLVFIASGTWAGFLFGDLMWWRDQDQILPINLWTYIQPFLVFCIPNLFVSGCLFFTNGTLSRKPIALYTQGVFLLVLYLASQSMLQNFDNKHIAAMIDPFGLQAFAYETQYWTPSERNQSLVPMSGYVLYNRLIWMGVGLAALIINYFCFNFNVVRNGAVKGHSSQQRKLMSGVNMALPTTRQVFNLATEIQQFLHLSKLYFVSVVKEIPFLGIVISGLLFLSLKSLSVGEMYGTNSYPTTYHMVSMLSGNFKLFFLILIVLYSGELVWRERSLRMSYIMDALPISSFNVLAAKFAGLVAVLISLLLLLIVFGMSIQTAYGYYKYEPGVYFLTLFTDTLAGIVLITFLSIFIQVLVNNKFLGYFVCVTFLILNSQLENLGVDHAMLRFSSGSLAPYSDMNGYGHFFQAFTWFKSYWFGFCLLLFAIAVLFSVRGSNAAFSIRWKSRGERLNRRLAVFILSGVILFLSSGFYIYYNTNIVHTYRNSGQQRQMRSEYEKRYKRFERLSQPRIVEANLKVDVFPSEQGFIAEGSYYLKNKAQRPIPDLHIQQSMQDHLIVQHIKFNRGVTVKQTDQTFGYQIYELKQPLLPGDSVRMDFKVSLMPKGFKEKVSSTQVVDNGTFFNNITYFPTLGYNAGYELTEDGDRKKEGLPPRERMQERSDERGKGMPIAGDDADRVRFEIILSTSADQRAIAPGRLQREWRENERRYFHYKMDAPMVNLYSIVSARYAVRRDHWKGVALEIYYHPGHEYNLDRMIRSMKDALEYCAANFGPYQYSHMRIMEFPRYESFAQSFAHTIPFSEGLGFIARIDDPAKDIDYPYYATAHEVAHQWWGHQTIPAGVKGGLMLSEGMSQYAALMVMKREFAPEVIERYLKFELDRYLKGRTTENQKEQPLQVVEGQRYIHYHKASLVFFALQDCIGEDQVNAAFRKFNQEWRFKDGIYPTSSDLLKYIQEVTPDSLKYVIHDMFETITLYENKTLAVEYTKKDTTLFEVALTVSVEKIRADSLGTETATQPDDWIDVGVFSKIEGEEKLIYLQKHKFSKKHNSLVIEVNQRPSRAGIDPLHKLIDRHSNDNSRIASEINID